MAAAYAPNQAHLADPPHGRPVRNAQGEAAKSAAAQAATASRPLVLAGPVPKGIGTFHDNAHAPTTSMHTRHEPRDGSLLL